jgi:hypothetical protein
VVRALVVEPAPCGYGGCPLWDGLAGTETEAGRETGGGNSMDGDRLWE